MGSQMMFSSNSGGGGSGLISYSPITRQQSIYSSTVEELQNVMNCEPGKRFGSMNMDEFLKNIWVAEDSQAASTTTTADPGYGDQQPRPRVVMSGSISGGEDVTRNVQRQPPDAISTNRLNRQTSPSPSAPQKRQEPSTVTLADFMVRNGLSREDTDSASPASCRVPPPGPLLSGVSTGLDLCNPMPSNNTLTAASMVVDKLPHPPRIQPDWINLANKQQQQQFAGSKRGFAPSSIIWPGRNPIYDGFSEGPGYGNMNATQMPQSSLAPSLGVSEFLLHGKKRAAVESIIEKSAERKQKRMIKNRESAARSRARKQAYTVELESEVKQLQEENARLRQQQAFNRQLPESGHPQQSQIRVLRRTRSF